LLLDNGLDLWDQGGVDELTQVDAANVVDEAKVDLVQGKGAQIEPAQDAELLELDEVLDLLELDQAVDVKGIVGEQARKVVEVQPVDGGELLEHVEVKGVDDAQVLEILAVEGKVVEERCIDRGTRLLLLGRGGGSNGRKSGNEDSRELHFDDEGVVGLLKFKIGNGAQLNSLVSHRLF
jgi:hypothetical protein